MRCGECGEFAGPLKGSREEILAWYLVELEDGIMKIFAVSQVAKAGAELPGGINFDQALAVAILAGLPPFAPLALAARRLASVLALPPLPPNCAIHLRFP